MTLSSSMAYLSFNGCVIGSHRHGYAASLSQHRHQLSRIAPSASMAPCKVIEKLTSRIGFRICDGHLCGSLYFAPKAGISMPEYWVGFEAGMRRPGCWKASKQLKRFSPAAYGLARHRGARNDATAPPRHGSSPAIPAQSRRVHAVPE